LATWPRSGGHQASDLGHEEGFASGLAVDACHLFERSGAADHLGEQGGDIVLVEAFEGESFGPASEARSGPPGASSSSR
jgi:hypothetical protein